jgi:transposase-like protein
MKTRVVTDYFLHPTQAIHRRYEAIRAVIVEGLSLQEVARRFEVSYGTLRNWVSEFRREWDAGQPPPFSLAHREDVPRVTAFLAIPNRRLKSQTSKSCRWKQDAD